MDSIRIEFFEETLKREGVMNLSTIGTSMLPGVCPGDVITVVPCLVNEIHPNDIVILKKDGALISHRVYKVEINEIQGDHSVIYTKGDNKPMPDAPSNASAVIAKVIGFKKKTAYHLLPCFLLKPIIGFREKIPRHLISSYLLKLIRRVSFFLYQWLVQIHNQIHKKTFYRRLVMLKNKSFLRTFNIQSLKRPLHNFSHMEAASHKKSH